MVVGHRIGGSRERDHLGVGARGVRVEAEVGDWSTSKTVSPASSVGAGVPGVGCEGGAVVFRRRISWACSKACPRRFLPHQKSGQEARGSRALRLMPHRLS